jgi:hypothetical protein
MYQTYGLLSPNEIESVINFHYENFIIKYPVCKVFKILKNHNSVQAILGSKNNIDWSAAPIYIHCNFEPNDQSTEKYKNAVIRVKGDVKLTFSIRELELKNLQLEIGDKISLVEDSQIYYITNLPIKANLIQGGNKYLEAIVGASYQFTYTDS